MKSDMQLWNEILEEAHQQEYEKNPPLYMKMKELSRKEFRKLYPSVGPELDEESVPPQIFYKF